MDLGFGYLVWMGRLTCEVSLWFWKDVLPGTQYTICVLAKTIARSLGSMVSWLWNPTSGFHPNQFPLCLSFAGTQQLWLVSIVARL